MCPWRQIFQRFRKILPWHILEWASVHLFSRTGFCRHSQLPVVATCPFSGAPYRMPRWLVSRHIQLLGHGRDERPQGVQRGPQILSVEVRQEAVALASVSSAWLASSWQGDFRGWKPSSDWRLRRLDQAGGQLGPSTPRRQHPHLAEHPVVPPSLPCLPLLG